MRPRVGFALLLVFVSSSVFATTFIVPSDDELIDRSAAIVVGTVEGSYVEEAENTIETVYEVRIERAIKGMPRANELLRITTLGGVIGERGLFVPAEAQFVPGERVLLFLSREGGRWRTTDMTLGKFRFVTSTTGERLLVRNMEDVFGWDRSGRVPEEKVRREPGFLRFIESTVRGVHADRDYTVSSGEVTLSPSDERFTVEANAAAFPPETYTSWVSGQPGRWPNISAGVNFYKRSDQNIPGASDGGVSAIQSGLAAWTNECGSVINLVYAGQRSTASANHDGVNVVEYNDPQGRVGGSWTGAGTIAITFISYGGNHSFASRTWWNITDADVVFQDGFPATHGAFATAMTHELGHAIGWRHSNQHYDGGGACNSSVEECTSAAIMNSSAVASYGYTLQPWDVNASQAVYPGGSCGPICTAPSITTQPVSVSITAGQSVTLSVAATGTTPLSYQWYRGTSGDTSNPVSGGTGATLTVSPTSTTSYWVRVSNSCGSVSSGTATVTVSAAPPPPSASKFYLVSPCRLVDTRASSPLASGATRTFNAAGSCGIPSGATAISVNLTVVSPPSSGYMSLSAGSGAPSGTSTINFPAGKTLANNALVRLLSNQFTAYYNGGGSIHFIVDVNGYFR